MWRDNRADGGSDCGIYFNRSLDGGRTWLAADVRLDAALPGVSSNQAVIASSGSHVFIAWRDSPLTVSSSISFTRSLDSGSSWSEILKLDVGLQGSTSPKLSNDGDVVYAVWSTSGTIQYTVSPMAGAPGTWTLPISISGPMFFVGEPAIASAGSNVYVVWAGLLGPGYRGVFFNRTSTGALGGGFFQMPIKLDTLPLASPVGIPNYLSLACSGSEVYVVWCDDRNHYTSHVYDVFFQRSHDGGLSFLGSDVQLDQETGTIQDTVFRPTIGLGIGSPTRVYVAWEDGDSVNGISSIHFKASQNGGNTWPIAETRLDSPLSATTDAWEVDLDAVGSTVAAVWTNDYGSGSRQVFTRASFNGGLSWDLMEVKLNTGGSVYTGRPQVAMETPTKLHAVWTDRRPPLPGESCCHVDIYANVWEPGLTVANVAGASTFSLDVTMDPFLPYAGAASHYYWPGFELANWRQIPLYYGAPLHYDSLAMMSIDPAYASIFSAFTGSLDATGHASPTIYYPPGVLSGTIFYVAFLTLDPAALDGIRTVTRGLRVTVP